MLPMPQQIAHPWRGERLHNRAWSTLRSKNRDTLSVLSPVSHHRSNRGMHTQRHIRVPNCKVTRASASKSSIFPSPCETYLLQSPTKARPRIKCPKLGPYSKARVRLVASCLPQNRKKQPGDTSLHNGRGKGQVENKPDDIVPKK